MPSSRSRSRCRTAARCACRAAVACVLLATAGAIVWLSPALYRHWVRFPREVTSLAALEVHRQPVTVKSGWTEYRGIVHSHSLLSHDCEVSFERILEVLRETGRDFICLSDHATEGRAEFGRQWRGLHEGKLFIPGYEMRRGWMPFGVASGTVLRNDMDSDTLARRIVEGGGLLFYAHPEEPREWDRPELVGMEIYNIHADFKDEPRGLFGLLPDLIVNQRRFPEQVFRRLFDRPTANLERWDALNRTRPVVGVAGNDCHQNTGLRATVTPAGTLRIEDTSPETLAEIRLNWLTRPFARLCFGPLEPGRMLFHLQLDPYDRMARFVTTHVLARELTEPAILEALKAGRVFIGFDHLLDSSGFLWLAEGPGGPVVMGEALTFSRDVRLRGAAPHPCRFRVIKDGDVMFEHDGRDLEYVPTGPGNYRVEAELRLAGQWVPWVYANPIRLRSPD